jgi:hypothetical protein
MLSETHPGITLPPRSLDAALFEAALVLEEHGQVDPAAALRTCAGLTDGEDKAAAVAALFLQDPSLHDIQLPEDSEDYSHLRWKQLRHFIAERIRSG